MMENEKKVKILQAMYTGVLADSVLRMGKEGILKKVTEEKMVEQLMSGKARAAQMGISKPEDVFLTLSEIFGCANWKILEKEGGFGAEATICMLCGFAKRMGTQSPCKIYCLDPMEGMIKGINPNAVYTVNGTLFEGQKCSVDVISAR